VRGRSLAHALIHARLRSDIMEYAMSGKEDIKIFAQQTLGCGCPEEVFEHIDSQSDVQLDGRRLSRIIKIGNRLLIYIVEMADADSVKQNLAFLVASGRKERDRIRFNRFRLVLTADDITEVQKVAEAVFAVINRDEKVHLHVIPKKSIPFL
jgi:hypothetical protein